MSRLRKVLNTVEVLVQETKSFTSLSALSMFSLLLLFLGHDGDYVLKVIRHSLRLIEGI